MICTHRQGVMSDLRSKRYVCIYCNTTIATWEQVEKAKPENIHDYIDAQAQLVKGEHMSQSKIEWTERTWNPLAGCKEVSPGCTNCYAARMAKRLESMGVKKYQETTKTLNNGRVAWTGKINLLDEDDDQFTEPMRTKKPTTYFVNSMSDLFHEDVPFDFIDKVFAVMAIASHHTFQVLTKRPDRMATFLDSECSLRTEPLPNVWLGTSVEDQIRADQRIPHLLRCPASIRFLSCEPLLGQINLQNICCRYCPQCKGNKCFVNSEEGGIVMGCPCEKLSGLDWVIVGGESGLGARPMQYAWVETLRYQCHSSGVRFFFKQWGAWAPFTQLPDDTIKTVELDRHDMTTFGQHSYHRLGKKLTGRLLDGKVYDAMPKVK